MRPIDARLSSTNVVIVETDLGQGFLKAIGNPAGTHCLACELVATQLAEWIGLQTLDYGLIKIDETIDEIRMYSGAVARSGPAFITRLESGDVWDGSKAQLRKLMNPEDISRLIVFDTWIMNRDRKSRLMLKLDNVLMSTEKTSVGKLRLVAIDHTHCFGASGDVKLDLSRLETPDDSDIYGLFPEFPDFLKRSVVRSAAERLRTLEKPTVEAIVTSIPTKWNVTSAVRRTLVKLIVDRAAWVAENIEERLFGPKYKAKELRFGESEEQP